MGVVLCGAYLLVSPPRRPHPPPPRRGVSGVRQPGFLPKICLSEVPVERKACRQILTNCHGCVYSVHTPPGLHVHIRSSTCSPSLPHLRPHFFSGASLRSHAGGCKSGGEGQLHLLDLLKSAAEAGAAAAPGAWGWEEEAAEGGAAAAHNGAQRERLGGTRGGGGAVGGGAPAPARRQGRRRRGGVARGARR